MPLPILKDHYRVLIERILADQFAAYSCAVYLFGSRATGRARPGSDVDLAVESELDLSRPIRKAREAFEESTLPYTVDLVELRRAPPELVAAVHEEGVLLWKS